MVKLYYGNFSPPSRFALIVSKIVGVDVELVEPQLFEMEHLKEDYKKINPTQTIPVFVENELKIFDSNAIAIYLVEKYGSKDDSLYPKNNLLMRTKINERLFYNASYLFPRLYNATVPVYLGSTTEMPKFQVEGILKGYGSIEAFLEGDNPYVCGDTMTLSDLSFWTTLESAKRFVAIDYERFPKLNRWFKLMNKLPYNELNVDGGDAHFEIFSQFLERNRAAAACKIKE